MGAGLYDPAFATLGRLYGHAGRSSITTLTLFGGFASTVCWPLSAFLEAHLGWRGACMAYAGFQLCVAVPVYLLLLPREPQHFEPSATQAPPPTRAAALPKLSIHGLLPLLATTIAYEKELSRFQREHGGPETRGEDFP